ncbi:MAG: hypothetical protein HYT39_00680 [Candidatus Sungbacteria bacterium]|nr:hypothetical protein [Candidatus Sungbacteria bacterium]
MASSVGRTSRIQVVADFGAVLPSVLAFRFSKRDKNILFLERESLHVPSSLEGLEFFRASLKALIDFTDGLGRKTGDKVKNILVALPNDAVIRSVPRQVRATRPHPNLPTSQEELKALWKRISSPETMGQFMENGTLNHYEPISYELESIELDGYPLENSYGASGKELSVSFIATFWPRSYREVVEKIKPAVHSSNLDFMPRIEALRSYFLFCEGSNASGIFLDIGFRDSLILVFKDGIIAASSIFPFGAGNIMRSIGEHFKLTADNARVIYGQWIRGEADAGVAGRLDKIATRQIELWERESSFFLGKIAKHHVLNPNIYCTGWGSTLPILLAELSEPKWREHWSSGSGEVSVLFPREQISKIFCNNSIFKTPDDSVLFALVLRMMQKDIK